MQGNGIDEQFENLQNNHSVGNGTTYGSIRAPSSSSSSLQQTGQLQETDSGYTEFNKGSVPCPTCRGLGHVPKEQEDQLIALIPMKDKRLKPRRTYLWVGLAVFLCLTTAGLLVFFMFPRSVNLSTNRPYLNPLGTVYINVTKQVVRFKVMNHFNVSNQNYFPVTVTGMEVSVQYDTQVISQTKNHTSLEIPIRSMKEYFIETNITLDSKDQLGYMASSCKNPIRWAHEMVMRFEVTCNYSFLGHSEQTTLQSFQFVSCYSVNNTDIDSEAVQYSRPMPDLPINLESR